MSIHFPGATAAACLGNSLCIAQEGQLFIADRNGTLQQSISTGPIDMIRVLGEQFVAYQTGQSEAYLIDPSLLHVHDEFRTDIQAETLQLPEGTLTCFFTAQKIYAFTAKNIFVSKGTSGEFKEYEATARRMNLSKTTQACEDGDRLLIFDGNKFLWKKTEKQWTHPIKQRAFQSNCEGLFKSDNCTILNFPGEKCGISIGRDYTEKEHCTFIGSTDDSLYFMTKDGLKKKTKANLHSWDSADSEINPKIYKEKQGIWLFEKKGAPLFINTSPVSLHAEGASSAGEAFSNG